MSKAKGEARSQKPEARTENVKADCGSRVSGNVRFCPARRRENKKTNPRRSGQIATSRAPYLTLSPRRGEGAGPREKICDSNPRRSGQDAAHAFAGSSARAFCGEPFFGACLAIDMKPSIVTTHRT